MGPSMFLGIDFSSVRQAKQGKTVVALLCEDDAQLVLQDIVSLQSDEELFAFLRLCPFSLCGIDAPLSLPPCVLCREASCECPFSRWLGLLGGAPETPFHYRLSDLLLRRTLPHISPKPPISNGGPVDITPLTMRWLRLSRRLVQEGIALDRIVEVYASGAIQRYAWALGLRAKKAFPYRTDLAARETMLRALCATKKLQIPDALGEIVLESEDAFDALFAALTTWHTYHRRHISPSMLLALSEGPSDIRYLQDVPEEERKRMAAYLRSKQWIFLPDVRIPNEEPETDKGHLH